MTANGEYDGEYSPTTANAKPNDVELNARRKIQLNHSDPDSTMVNITQRWRIQHPMTANKPRWKATPSLGIIYIYILLLVQLFRLHYYFFLLMHR